MWMCSSYKKLFSDVLCLEISEKAHLLTDIFDIQNDVIFRVIETHWKIGIVFSNVLEEIEWSEFLFVQ